MFKPVNRYVHIRTPEEGPQSTESGILLPEGFKPSEERYICVQALSAADDVKFKEMIGGGCKLIVDKSMIEQINFMGKSINVILENYILGVVS